MTECARCGREIKNVYTFDGESYGRSCFSTVLEEYKHERKEEAFDEWASKCDALITVLEEKDMSNISNNFKLQFIPSVIDQYRNEGWLSKKQYNMAFDMLNKADKQLLNKLNLQSGLIDIKDYYYRMHLNCYSADTDFWWEKYVEAQSKYVEAKREAK